MKKKKQMGLRSLNRSVINKKRQESEDKNELKVQESNASPSEEASIMRVPALASLCTSESSKKNPDETRQILL
jgi:hypothetical protein